MSKRDERVKRKKLARQEFIREQRKIYKQALRNPAPTEYGIAQKINGRWVYVYKTLQETCRDSMFEILKHTPCPVRRVDL